MIPAAEEFLRQMDRCPVRLVAAGAAGEAALDDVTYDAAWCSGSFSLGNACSAVFTGTTAEGTFQKGDRVTLRLELTGVETEAVVLGTFTLTQVEGQADSPLMELTGTDAMGAELEQPFCCENPEVPPETTSELLEEISRRTGLEVLGAELVPQVPVTLTLDGAGVSTQSMRQLLAAVALTAGANACIAPGGEIWLRRWGSERQALGPERYYESGLRLEGENVTLGALELTVPQLQQGEDGTVTQGEQTFSAQLEGASQGLSLTGLWCDQAAFDAIWSRWQGCSFRAGEVTCLGLPLLEVGDLLEVTDRAGERYLLPVMGLRHRCDGGIRTTVTAYALPATGEAVPQTVSQAITGLQAELGRFRSLYADNLAATNGQITHLTGEDIVGEHGTINLSQGTFQFGDALTWDGETLEVRGVLDSREGQVGGWTIGADRLSSYPWTGQDEAGEPYTAGDPILELVPGVGDESPAIRFHGSSGWAGISPYLGERYGELQRLEIVCDKQLWLNGEGLRLYDPEGSCALTVDGHMVAAGLTLAGEALEKLTQEEIDGVMEG